MNMVNLSDLKAGQRVKALCTNDNGIKEGEIYKIKRTGYSRWDQDYYADIISSLNHEVEINRFNMKDFELA